MSNTMQMDKDLANGTVTTMQTVIDELSSARDTMNSNVNNLVGTSWVGNAATEFERVYGEWGGKMTGIIDELETLKNTLKTEIESWEAVDQSGSLG